MSAPPETSEQNPRRIRRWRRLALLILLLGGGGAGLDYWLGQPAVALRDDPAMQGFNRATHRQMGQLFGKSGYVIDDLVDSLKKPGTQAVLIVVISALLAGGCVFISRLPEIPPDPDFFKPSNSADDGNHRDRK